MATPVLNEWVFQLPYKQQSALLSGLRGPDDAFHSEVKKIAKFIRHATSKNADPESGYMEENWHELDFKKLERQLEFCSLHYVAHAIEALGFIEYYSDDLTDSDWAGILCRWFENTFHLAPRKIEGLQ